MSSLELSPSELKQIDAICDSFESEWKSGQSPVLDEVAETLSNEIRQACLVDLVILDAYYRHQSGISTSPENHLSTDPTCQSTGTLNSLNWEDYVKRFPELGAIDCPAEFTEASQTSMIDERFRITGLRATGGLGQVSTADDLQFGRTVAIKEIRTKYADQQDFRERFLREAEITGRLEHPSIVPVYAMGQTTAGQPYYAMRLIQGRSLLEAINDYHKEHHVGVTVELRKLLQRLIDICDAVEYAHSRDVIHRDIKPENIMLGDYGETLLVDWGLAKILGQEETLSPSTALAIDPIQTNTQTRAGTVLGTPAYMSPEQTAGDLDRVNQLSDVFALGATLHHLVCGRAPGTGFMGSSEKAYGPQPKPQLKRQNKQHPSLAPVLAIATKAMSAAPAERYSSARDFASEIELFLADQPIAVFRDPIETRIWRWIRNHRAMAGASVAAACLALVALLAYSWLVGNHALEVENKNAQLDRMVKRETQLRNEAEQSERRTVDALNYLVGALRSPDPNLDGREIKVVDILDQAASQLDADFSDDPLMLARMLQAIGITYKGLGQFSEALKLVERSHEIYKVNLGPESRETLNAQTILADLCQRVGDARATNLITDVLKVSARSLPEDDADRLEFRRVAATIEMQSGNAGQAANRLEQLIPVYETKFGPDSSTTVSLLNDLANAWHLDGRSAQAASISKRVYETRLQEYGAESLKAITNGSNYAAHLLSASDRQTARVILERLLTISRSSLGDDHFQTLAIMSRLGSLYIKDNNLEKGIELLKESMQRSEQAYGPEHSRTLVAATGLGVAYLESGDYLDAARQLRTVYDASVKTRGAEHPESLTVANNLASVYRLTKDYDAAIEIFETTIAAQKERLRPGHPATLRSMLNLAVTLQQASRPGDSIPICQEANQLASEHVGNDSGQVQTAQSLEAMASLTLKDFENAVKILEAGHESRIRTMPDHWLRYNTMSLLGEAYLGLNQLAKAEPLLLLGYQKMLEQKSKIPTRAHVRIEQARERLVRLYEAKDMSNEADKYRAPKKLGP